MEYNNYRGISLVGEIYTGILVERVLKATEDLIDDEQSVFRTGRGLCRSDIYLI